MVISLAPTLDQPIIDTAPQSAYELITREKVEHMAADIAEIRHRVNAMFYLVIGSVVIETLLKVMS